MSGAKKKVLVQGEDLHHGPTVEELSVKNERVLSFLLLLYGNYRWFSMGIFHVSSSYFQNRLLQHLFQLTSEHLLSLCVCVQGLP